MCRCWSSVLIDTYQNISNDAGQVAAILDYVKKGKSIIFAHDTTSYVNYDYTKMTKSIPDTAYGSGRRRIFLGSVAT